MLEIVSYPGVEESFLGRGSYAVPEKKSLFGLQTLSKTCKIRAKKQKIVENFSNHTVPHCGLDFLEKLFLNLVVDNNFLYFLATFAGF